MNEIWRSIKDYEGLYEVSNWGRVRNSRTGRVLRPGLAGNGYYTVNICRRNSKCIHRLVAEAFIPNPNNYPEVNHKDENKLNNRVDNLEWCPAEYNINYGTGNERRLYTERLGTIYQYTPDGRLYWIWRSATECSKITGFSQGNISAVCRGSRKSAYGYKWSYEPPKLPKALPYYVI